MTARLADIAPGLKARIAGVFYLLTFLTGGFALLVRSPLGAAAGLIAAACYLAVTVLLYYLFKPVSRSLSLLAALVSVAGIIAGPAGLTIVNPLVFFGVYCLLIGGLIHASGLLPRFVGVLMLCAGLGWLTFLSPPLSTTLYPYNLAPGLIGEGALTLCLLVIGVNVGAESGKLRVPSRMHV
jgi:hypothetical protein